MHDRIVSDADIISNMRLRPAESAVNYSAVLHIHLISHPDLVHIPPDHCIEPETALVSGPDIPDQGRIRGNETIFSQLGQHAVYW
jgi:hypothetical protein